MSFVLGFGHASFYHPRTHTFNPPTVPDPANYPDPNPSCLHQHIPAPPPLSLASPHETDDLYTPVRLVSFGAGNRRVGGYCLRPFLTGPLLKTRRFLCPITASRNNYWLICRVTLAAVTENPSAIQAPSTGGIGGMKPTRCQSVFGIGDTNGDTSPLKPTWFDARI